MDRIPLVTSSTSLPLEHFWMSVLLYHDRPHLVNRKLAAISPLFFSQLTQSSKIDRISKLFTREALLYETRKYEDLSKITHEFIENILEGSAKNVKLETSDFHQSPDGIFLSLRVLFARCHGRKCLEIVIFDKKNLEATFFAVQEHTQTMIAPIFPYRIELNSERNLRIILDSFEDADTRSAEWLADKLFPKLIKWAEESTEAIIPSLSLVKADQYCNLYNDLKNKYGKHLLEEWPSKANTDPHKFVYEDLAIAAYLIALWHKIGATDINFVDCGCGNGLLVYILNSEGFKGHGLDVRARKIWDLFSGKANLEVGTVTPQSLFPSATWLIGNHSDELTPWIPIIALNSSPATNFFVLPCCPFDFSGQKYVRMNTGISQYSDYLNYIKSICEKCGFKTDVDKLRIPSTKRTCLVGLRGSPNPLELQKIKSDVDNFVGLRLKSQFVARSPLEITRNCTQLSKDLLARIVAIIVENLLKYQDLVDKSDGASWNRGGIVPIGKLIAKVPQADLKSLKSECGGLQTLLKNHGYIFEVKLGAVRLRQPRSFAESGGKYRDKPCWFYLNHPDGCLYNSDACGSRH